MHRAGRSSTRHLATSLSLAASLAVMQLGVATTTAQTPVRPVQPLRPVRPLRPARPAAPQPQMPDAA